VAVTPTTINTSEIQVTVPTQTGWAATPITVTTPGGTSAPNPSWLTWTYPAAGSAALPAPQANVADPTVGWLVGSSATALPNDPVAFINYARSLEDIGPIYLPADYYSLPADAKLLFLVNEERIARGLPAFTGTTAYQNNLAYEGATKNSDPPLPYGGGGVWAASSSVIQAEPEWMYQDGYGYGNGACTTPTAVGCWGHRTNILTQYQPQPTGAYPDTMTMGGAGSSATADSTTAAVFAAGGTNPNEPYVTSWASILPTIPTTPPVPIPTSANLSAMPTNGADFPFNGTGGQTLSLFGAYLGSATSVHFGSVAVTTISRLNPSEIQVTVPAQPGGTVAPVTVTDAAGTSATSDLPAFTYLYPQPTITSITPAYTTNPSVATTVTLTGTGFSVVGTETLNTCGPSGTVAVPFVVNSDTSITAQVPAYPQSAGATSDCSLSITTPGGTAYSQGSFLWLGTLGFSSMSPSSGPANQSQSVTVHGSFTSGATFTVGGNPVTPTNVTDSGMAATITVPPNPAGDVAGTTMIDVTFAGATAGESFAWTGAGTPQPPIITSVSPSSGLATQSQTVTLAGSGFSGAAITSTGAAVRIVSESSDSMVVYIPQNPSGNVNGSVTVNVANDAGSTDFSYNWTAYSPPVCPSGDTGTYPDCIPPTTYPNPPLSSISSTSVVDMTSTPDGGGYWLVNAAGDVSAHGDATNYGGLGAIILNAPIAHIVSTPDGKGYWLVAGDGGTFAFGDAGFFGSMGGQHLNAPVVEMAPTPTGKGYWLVASDGGVFAFGDAQFYGSMGGRPLNKPVIGITAAGGGYRMVASDGGIFSFGAPFYGSMGGQPLNRPIVGMADTASGGGYWMVASDGGIFAFGNAGFHGSMGGQPLNQPIVAMAGDPATGGYWEVAADGGIFSFGAPFYGAD